MPRSVRWASPASWAELITARAASGVPGPGRARTRHGGGRIMADVLVVDDNLDISELLEALLAEEGHLVRVAHDGEEGLRALDERLSDVVILDVDMPVLDGPGMA